MDSFIAYMDYKWYR